MTGETIMKLIGKPASITPITTPEGNAETWTYRRLLNDEVFQTANTQTTIPAFVAINADGPVIADTIVPEYRLKYRTTYQVTSLLMFEGKLILARQWREQDEGFAN